MCISRPLRQRGVTLIEMIFFIMIVSVALAGMVQVFNLATRDSADPVRRKQALMLAEAMMAEVQLAGFTWCDPTDDNAATAVNAAGCANPALQEKFGPEQASARPFDNVNDYVTAANVAQEAFGPKNALTDVNGNTIDVEEYAIKLTVSPVALAGIGSTGADSDLLQITIVVEYDSGQSVRLDGFRLRYAPQFR